MNKLIQRAYNLTTKELLVPGRVLFIVGPRRCGKTTFLMEFVKQKFADKKVKYVLGDNIYVQKSLSVPDPQKLKEYIRGFDVLVIDEVQLIPNIGATLKLLVDISPNLYVLATGSASLDIVQKAGEPLVGRKFTMTMYPFSIYELKRYFFQNSYELKQSLESILLYGLYPEVFLAKSAKAKVNTLYELVGSYIFRDILQLERLKYPFVLENLLKLLAYQIGSTVSNNELANELGIDVKTVEKYLWLLQKSYIIVPLRNYTRNKRNELKKSKKYYFTDLGIRNAVINDFASIEYRDDAGAIWENFVFIERLKKHEIRRAYVNKYFWRTKTKQEIDLIEEKDGILSPFECKFSKTKVKAPEMFFKYYPDAKPLKVVNKNNFVRFVG